MLRGRAGRWLARLVAAAAIVASAHGAVAAVVESRRLARYSRRHASESLVEVQDRLFGRDYMESIRAVRRKIDVDQTVRFVDEKGPDGSSYFALFHLAPRRLVRVGRLEDPLRHSSKRRVRGPDVVVLVPSQRAPLVLVETPGAPEKTRRHGRKARP